ncbi:dCTP deaminase [Nocardia brasiliensis]|uniref:dCTP deaminase n=1 Tax=Nocardia brasiliensis TaxID=37326 RepID=UPI002458E69F|nr:hypothetical protein [Nocardia brasiliensis]
MLTGTAIGEAVAMGEIVIDPFDPDRLCANSYSFALGDTLLRYRTTTGVLDPMTDAPVTETIMGETGFVLEPGILYLGSTVEVMGGLRYAATLHACRSVSSLGLRIQLSAPLGHCGAVIPWTLELRAAMAVRVYPGMTIGKIAFWPMQGRAGRYAGRYAGSGGVVRSLLSIRCPAPPASREVIPSAGPDPVSSPFYPQREVRR